MNDTLDPALLELPLRGRNLDGATLGAQLEGGPQVVIFLRHFG